MVSGDRDIPGELTIKRELPSLCRDYKFSASIKLKVEALCRNASLKRETIGTYNKKTSRGQVGGLVQKIRKVAVVITNIVTGTTSLSRTKGSSLDPTALARATQTALFRATNKEI